MVMSVDLGRTVPETMKLLRMSRGKIYQLVNEGYLVKVNIGGGHRMARITEESIKRLIHDIKHGTLKKDRRGGGK
jgi:hypothetical protein